MTDPTAADRPYLQQWLNDATDDQVMALVAEMGRVSPGCVKCFRLLALVLVGAKSVDRKHVYGEETTK